MRNFWALPALLRVAIAAQNTFSVQDDVLAFPQYQLDFAEHHISDIEAQSRLSKGSEAIDNDDDVSIYSSDDTTPRKLKQQYQYEELVLANQHYLCQIPRVVEQPPAPQSNETLSKKDQEKELARANDRGWQLLQGMQENCIYFWSGWWSYRYCYGQGVKQFHQLPPSQGVPAYPPVEDPGVPGFMLGTVQEPAQDSDQTPAASSKAVGKLETRGESRYLVQRLGGGTVCDLTGRERRIEVQFHCNPATSDRISLIKEISTCAYLMVIQTPRLCNDIAFLPPQKDRANKISCSPILSQDQIPEYEASLAAASDLLAADIPNPFVDSQSAEPQVIGGITLGAHRWIPESKKIEKSAIVGGGKQKAIATVADSFGKLMSSDELKKLGLGDSKSVEKLKKELEEIAGGQGWKLEVYDTPQGREYHGVLLGDDETDATKKDGASSADEKTEDIKTNKEAAPKQDQKQKQDRKQEPKQKQKHKQEQKQQQEGSEETYKDEL